MATADNNNKVRVHYTVNLDDGTECDSSRNSDPLEFTIGNDEIIPGVEDAVKGMEEGEEKQVTLAPEQGYGNRNEEAVMEIPKDQLPEDVDPQVGMSLQGQTQDGNNVTVWITEVKDDAVTVDANHPLAGENLNFNLELVKVVE